MPSLKGSVHTDANRVHKRLQFGRTLTEKVDELIEAQVKYCRLGSHPNNGVVIQRQLQHGQQDACEHLCLCGLADLLDVGECALGGPALQLLLHR